MRFLSITPDGREYLVYLLLALREPQSPLLKERRDAAGTQDAFSHFDHMYVGTYRYISPKHLQAYANECAYRYNTRKNNITVRFEDTVLKCSSVRLNYNQLTSK